MGTTARAWNGRREFLEVMGCVGLLLLLWGFLATVEPVSDVTTTPRVEWTYERDALPTVTTFQVCVAGTCRDVGRPRVNRRPAGPTSPHVTIGVPLEPREVLAIDGGADVVVKACDGQGRCSAATAVDPPAAPTAPSPRVSQAIVTSDADLSIRIDLEQLRRDVLICLGAVCGIPAQWERTRLGGGL